MGSPERIAFLKRILKMSSAEIARHWLSKKNEASLTPPKAVSSDRLMIKYLKKYPGAFAILRKDIAKKAKLKVLMTL